MIKTSQLPALFQGKSASLRTLFFSLLAWVQVVDSVAVTPPGAQVGNVRYDGAKTALSGVSPTASRLEFDSDHRLQVPFPQWFPTNLIVKLFTDWPTRRGMKTDPRLLHREELLNRPPASAAPAVNAE